MSVTPHLPPQAFPSASFNKIRISYPRDQLGISAVPHDCSAALELGKFEGACVSYPSVCGPKVGKLDAGY